MKKEKSFPKFKISIFLKMLIVLGTAGLAINFLVFETFHRALGPKQDGGFRSNLVKYIKYVITDVAQDPSFARAKALCTELNIGMRIEGKGASWVSDESLPTMAEAEQTFQRFLKGPGGPPPGFHLMKDHPPSMRPAVVIHHIFPNGPAKVAVFFPPGPVPFGPNMDFIFPLLALLSFVLLFSFGLIRWILRPLRLLEAGVEKISEGNLDVNLSYRSQDEFGRLVTAFNQMALKLKNMIESQRRLLIDVSHELRSPLQRMKISLEFISDPKNRKEMSEEVVEMSQLVEQLLEGAELENSAVALKLKEESLTDLAGEVVERFHHRGIPVELKEPRPPARVKFDNEQIRTVLKNIIENAVKYSAEKSPIEVAVEETSESVSVSVQDFGIGIAPEDHDKIFEPFYRVDRSRTRSTGGFGLGLNLCKKIVQAHGGKLSVQSAIDKGTKITVILKKR